MPLYKTRSVLPLSLSAAAVLAGCQGPARTIRPELREPAPPTAWADAVSRALVEEGREQLDQGNRADALAAYTQALQKNPRLTEAHLGIGEVFRTQGDYDQAAAAYRNAIVTDPNNFDARYFYGLSNQLDGLLDLAIASYERALVIRPDSFPANRDMGSAQLQHGDAEAAIPFAQRATELDPESQAAWANLAAAYSLVGDYSGAIEAYRQTLELGEPAEPIMLGLADAHIQMGNYQRAENVLRATLRTGSSAIGYERLGFVLFRQGRFEDALSAYQEALKTEPDDLAAINGAGVCQMAVYLAGGENDDKMRVRALNSWRRSLSIDRDQPMLIDLISRYSEE